MGHAPGIAIFGGSFNPVHKGHAQVVESLNDLSVVDSLILLPTSLSPFKQDIPMLAWEHRLNMLSLMLSRLEVSFPVTVSDYELREGVVSYTIDTVRYFKSLYPNKVFYFVLGQDAFLSLHLWKEWKSLLSELYFIVLNRGEGRKGDVLTYVESILGSQFRDKIICHRMSPCDASSVDIRRQLLSGVDTIDTLDSSVFAYIKENNLYGD